MSGLHEQSESHPILLARFHELMRAYMLACDGSTQNIGGTKIAYGKKGSNPVPRSSIADDMARWDRTWRQQKTDRDRLEMLQEMQAAAIRLRYSPDNQTHRGTREWKMAIAHDERRAHVVANVRGVSVRTVYRLREELNATRPRRRLFSKGQARRSTP